MTQGDLFQTAISSQQDTHASLLVMPGSAEAQKMTAISGRTFLPLLKPNDPLFAFLKMFMVTLRWDSTKCYLTWKVKATQQGRLLFQLAQSMPLTNEIDSGLLHTPTTTANQMSPSMSKSGWWATPTTMDSLPSRSYKAMMRQATNGGRKNRSRPGNLREQIDPLMQQAYDEARAKANNQEFKRKIDPTMWPTPTVGCVEGGEQSSRVEKTNSGSYILRKKNKPHMTYGAKLSDAILFEEKQKMWPTPDANMGARGTQPTWAKTRPSGHPAQYTINQAVRDQEQSGQLNPDWVEWLMGYPKGWTDLDCDTPKPHAGFEKEPEDIPRVASKIKNRTNRLRGLGNAIVPQIAMKIGLAIKLNAFDKTE